MYQKVTVSSSEFRDGNWKDFIHTDAIIDSAYWSESFLIPLSISEQFSVWKKSRPTQVLQINITTVLLLLLFISEPAVDRQQAAPPLQLSSAFFMTGTRQNKKSHKNIIITIINQSTWDVDKQHVKFKKCFCFLYLTNYVNQQHQQACSDDYGKNNHNYVD